MRRDEEVGNSMQEVLQFSTRLMADKKMNEGEDVLCSKRETTSNTRGGQGGAKKPIKRKLYS